MACGALLPGAPARAATVDQPQPFNHQHHVSELGLDCRSCHATVDISANAGMPGDATCTNCHARLGGGNGGAARDGTPALARATRLPDFVNFDHSLHSARGVACAACHGDVEHAQAAAQANPSTTGWCADCHRHRERVASRIGLGAQDLHAGAFAAAAPVSHATRTAAAGTSCKVQADAAACPGNMLFSKALLSGM